MADIPDPDEVKDLAASIQTLAASMDDIKSSFRSVKGETQSWDKVLTDAVLKIEDMPGSIADSKDLWSAMTSDANFLKDIQKEINKMIKNEFNVELKKATQEYGAQSAEVQMLQSAQEGVLAVAQKQFNIAERHVKKQKEMHVEMLNANKLVKDFGTLMRDPAAGTDKLLGKLGELPGKLAEAKEETGSWGGALSKVGKEGFEKIMGPASKLFATGGIIAVGLAAATAALTGFFMLFKNFYNFLDKEVIPATADFNKQIGGGGKEVGKLRSQMSATGAEFQLLGKSFEEGAALVRDFSEAYKSVFVDQKDLKTAKELVAVVGLTAEQAGQTALQFSKQEGSLDTLRKTFTEAEKGAAAYGLPVNAVLRDLGNAPDVLTRFGTKNALEFAKATVKANSYGLSIQDVNAAFGEQFDSFEKSAQASANLNATLGTNINSFELMLETDPTKRLEMLRKELVKNGQEWENLTVFEKNLITQNLGVSKSQASLILSSEKQRKSLERQRKEQESLTKATTTWDKGIGRVKRTLIAWGAEIDMLMRSATEFVSALLGFEEPGKLIPKVTEKISKGFKSLRETFNEWTDMLKGKKEANTFIKVLQTMTKAVKVLWNLFEAGAQLIWDILEPVGEFIFEVTGLKQAFDDLGEVDWGETFSDMLLWLDSIDAKIEEFKNIDWGLIWGYMKTVFKEMWDDLIVFIKENAGVVIDTIKGVLFPFSNPDVLSGLVSGVKDWISGEPDTPKPNAVATAKPNSAPTTLKSSAMARSATPAATGAGTTRGVAGGGGSQNINVTLELDGQKLARAQVRSAQE